MNPKVDGIIAKAKTWRAEFKMLQAIALSCGLDEDLKWGQPCYSHEGANVVLIHGFKDYCALLFFKGALLKDPKGILVQQTKNVQSARQIRFTDLKDIKETVIKTYIKEAIAVKKSGQKVSLKKTASFDVPPEFKSALAENAGSNPPSKPSHRAASAAISCISPRPSNRRLATPELRNARRELWRGWGWMTRGT